MKLSFSDEQLALQARVAAFMDEHKLADPSLIRLREEAAALLEIEP